MAAALPQLTSAQQNALTSVATKAEANKARARARIKAVLDAAGVEGAIAPLITAISQHASLTINFHPDRLLSDGRSVMASLFEDGVYRNQFETQISNGGLTAFPGGERDRWEEAMLDGAYHAIGVTNAERPKYGGLNLMNYSNGACPRFGSCHLRLKHETLGRTTLTLGDSASQPKEFGVGDALESVLAGMLEEISATGNALARPSVDVPAFVHALLSHDAGAHHGLFQPTQSQSLDDYIEAQIHGPLTMATDVAALVADPSFQGTATGALFEAAAEMYPLALEWHPGYELALADVPDDFRGPEMPLLAKRVLAHHGGDRGVLNPAVLGAAAVSVVTSPGTWTDWGPPRETLQHIKYLWHVLVAYGKPRSCQG